MQSGCTEAAGAGGGWAEPELEAAEAVAGGEGWIEPT